jgi:dTDP-4-amino-4,6-dideoxygalactose transaminase
MKIPITKPYFGTEELEAVQQPLKSGWVVQGPFVKAFEDKFANYIDAQSGVATTSCTTALHIAVAALGLKPGDEVIVPAFTWVSTANVVEFMGATPVFCDINLQTFNIDVDQIEALITPHTVGIIPVHLFGLPADMGTIMQIAEKHQLWVVEDAACGLGAYYDGKHAGTFGNAGCFSFHPRKSITTGEGGMIVTDQSDLDEICRSLRDHGASKTDLQRHHEKASFLLAEYNRLGYNFRMTDIQGAIGNAQMDRIDYILEVRHKLAANYDATLAGLDWLDLPLVPDGYDHGYQSYVTLFRPEAPAIHNVERLHDQRNQFMLKLEEQGVGTRQGTHAVVTQGWYVKKYGFKPEDYPNAYIAEKLSLSLPIYVQMTAEEQEYVIRKLKEVKF